MKTFNLVLFSLLTICSDIFGQCTFTAGNENPGFTNIGSFGANYILGVKFSVSNSGTVTSLNLFGLGTTSNVQMALYKDNAGVPGNVLTTSAQGIVTNGPISLSVTPINLNSGDYWIMAIYDDTVGTGHTYRTTSSTKDVYYQSHSFGSTLPTNAGGFLTYCCRDYQYWMTLNDTIDTSITLNGANLAANQIGAAYQWLDCDNNFANILGETNQSFTATSSGNYAVEITNNGCVDTSACYSITFTGFIENNFGDRLLLYPNPTDGNFSIDLGSNYESVTITITEINGKIIQSNTYNESQLLNLKLEEPTGVYLLMIRSGNKKAVIRLLKE